MRLQTPAAVLAVASLAFSAIASANPAGDLESGLTWTLAFGAHAAKPALQFSAGMRSGEHFAPLSRLVQFDLDETTASALVGGVPVAARSFRVDEAGNTPAPDAASDARPWYTRGWVLWTAGGLAATAAALSGASSGSGNGETQHNTNCVSGCSQNAPNSLPQNQTCVPGSTCVYCNDGHNIDVVGGSSSGCFTARATDDSLVDEPGLDTGTGGMGDLEALN